jgi:hypothetical protein
VVSTLFFHDSFCFSLSFSIALFCFSAYATLSLLYLGLPSSLLLSRAVLFGACSFSFVVRVIRVFFSFAPLVRVPRLPFFSVALTHGFPPISS